MKPTAHSPSQILLDQLEQLAPETVLAISAHPVPALDAYAATHRRTRVVRLTPAEAQPSLDRQPRFDLALIADALEHLDAEAGAQLLGRLRNLHSDHLLVLIADRSPPTADDPKVGADTPRSQARSQPLSQTQLFGLGLVGVARFEHPGQDRALTLYSYDIASYNRVRDWNNPRYWANPGNWGKYWW